MHGSLSSGFLIHGKASCEMAVDPAAVQAFLARLEALEKNATEATRGNASTDGAEDGVSSPSPAAAIGCRERVEGSPTTTAAAATRRPESRP